MALVRSLALALVLGACSSAAVPTAATTPTTADGPTDWVVVSNQGGSLEGHTPRGFAGMGTGLFVGDNLNPGFPDGDGVQVYLTFELVAPADVAASAIVRSEVLTVRGSPFDDLGPLIVEVVEYEAFGPALFDLPAVSEPVVCSRVGETGIECDVSGIVGPALDGGETILQFRLKFERAGDTDGRADLAMFFESDSNTNEAGLFTLTIGG